MFDPEKKSNSIFHFFLGTFEGHLEPNVASDETYAQSKIDISGSDKTIQNALASMVWV